MRGKEIITKLIIPGAIAMIICLIVHPMCMNGEILDWRKLLLFVGIPLPGTGAWTGTLAASILDMDFKTSMAAVLGGVILAGVIMGLVSSGLFGGLGALLG